MALSCGCAFSLALVNNGDVAAFGMNSDGQLGVGDFNPRHSPVMLDKTHMFGGEEIVMVSAEETHSACVSREGNLWVFGSNRHGTLGLGHDAPRITSPVRIDRFKLNTHVVMVASGLCFNVILTSHGHVYTAGDNSEGTLGHGDKVERNTFTQINPAFFHNEPIGLIATGQCHVMALARKVGDVMYTWGSNQEGELGHSYPRNSDCVLIPTLLPTGSFGGAAVAMMDGHWHYSCVVTTDGALWGSGRSDFSSGTMRCLGGEEHFLGGGVRMVACGHSHLLIVTKEDTMWYVDTSSLNLNHFVLNLDKARLYGKDSHFNGEGIMVAAAGSQNCAVLTRQGKLYTWRRYGTRFTAGLGYSIASLQNVPQRVYMPALVHALRTERFGRWHDMRPEDRLALATGMYEHFAATGGQTVYSGRCPEELVLMILDQMRARPRIGTSDGFLDLIGRQMQDRGI